MYCDLYRGDLVFLHIERKDKKEMGRHTGPYLYIKLSFLIVVVVMYLACLEAPSC